MNADPDPQHWFRIKNAAVSDFYFDADLDFSVHTKKYLHLLLQNYIFLWCKVIFKNIFIFRLWIRIILRLFLPDPDPPHCLYPQKRKKCFPAPEPS
jgi:hypothetical protein